MRLLVLLLITGCGDNPRPTLPPGPTLPQCTPNCTGVVCGPDGCGGSCSDCDGPARRECRNDSLASIIEKQQCMDGQCVYVEDDEQSCDDICSDRTGECCVR